MLKHSSKTTDVSSLALSAVLGALAEAAASGAVTTVDTAMSYIKQILNEILGTDGGWTNLDNAAVADLDSAIQKLASILAIDVANQFSTSVDGSARTTLEAVHVALAALIGTKASAAATGAVTTSDDIVAYIKQLVTEGIARDTAIGNIPTTMVGTDNAALASAWTSALATALGNYTSTRAGYIDELAAANLPADIATVTGLIDTAETDASFSYLDAGGEQDVYTDAVTTRRKISFSMDISTMSQGGVVKVYLKVDGSTYKVWIKKDVDSISSSGTEDVYTIEIITNQHIKVSYTEDADEGADRSIPYSVVIKVME